MKYLLSILFFLFLGIEADAKGFSDNFKAENHHWNLGLLFGGIGQTEDLGMPVFAVSTTIYGFYFDVGVCPSSHKSDVRVDKWDDNEALMFHAGYQLPLTKWFRVIPIIGYSHCASGTTDGSNYHVTSNGIHNKFTADESFSKFDYGTASVFNINHINLQAAITRYSWYLGVGYEF